MDAISLVSAWNNIILQLCYIFTEPTAHTFRQIMISWVLRRGPVTVTGMFRTLGNLADKHWTVYQKFFFRAAWSLKELSIVVMVQVIYPLIIESGVLDESTGKPGADLTSFQVFDTRSEKVGNNQLGPAPSHPGRSAICRSFQHHHYASILFDS